MSSSSVADAMHKANVRLCRLRVWSDYTGLGFTLETSQSPPFFIRTVESNSPAAAGGLKISDIILSVNDEDMTGSATFSDVGRAIKAARATNQPIDLLVVERRFYNELKGTTTSFDPTLAKLVQTPTTMPRDYKNFPKHTPRTCDIRLSKTDTSFGFEGTSGENETGLYVQEVVPNSPASLALLRKCDRILEIDDKFVDKESSKTITGKIGKAREKRGVKLYVVDTATYKHFNDNKIPLQSKDFRKSKFAKELAKRPPVEPDDLTDPEQNDPDDPTPIPDNTSTLRSDVTSVPTYKASSDRKPPEDIRLCTIDRTSATDSYGIELNYHKREQFHSLKITPGRNNEQSNAERAGVRPEDRLIEINGQNVENMGNDEVKQCIRAIKYPERLQLLVADTATYEYYKQNNKTIHSGLPSVRDMARSKPGRSPSPVASLHQPSVTRSSSTTTDHISRQPDLGRPSAVALLATTNPLIDKRTPSLQQQKSDVYPSSRPISSTPSGRRQCRLSRIRDFKGYGFNVSSTPADGGGHKVSQITSSSPAELQGLHVGDYILSVNGQNVEHMDPVQFNQFLRSEVQNDSAHEGSILLEVIDEDSYEPTPVVDVIHKSRPPSHVSSDEPYPEMRLCTLRSLPSFEDFGFDIHQTSGGHDGFQILNLQRNSPAAQANINNGDQLIEVNKTNIETQNFQYVDQLINNAYHRDRQITLLVIDDDGYQWYKSRRMRIDPNADKANVAKHYTPEPPAPIKEPVLPTYSRQSSNGITPVIRIPPTSSRDQHTSVQTFHNDYEEPEKYDEKPSNVIPISTRRFRPLSRAAVDVISGKSMFRFCRLHVVPGESFGFELAYERNKHVIHHIKPDSSAAQAGLNDRDYLIEVDEENVTQKSHRDVAGLIKNANRNGVVRLLITPGDIRPLTDRSAKSLSALNDERYYRDTNSWSRNDGQQQQPSSLSRHRSTSRLNREQNYSVNEFTNRSSGPSEPYPRQCVLVQDPTFRGCGFRLSEKENYDTPIVVEVVPNSPAKRSGLTEGDHIMYIDSQNVQNIRSFNDMTGLIQSTFRDDGQVILIALTGPAYQALKRRGGYLESAIFDYQSTNVNEMKPRLCQLTLYKHEHDFGFQLQLIDSLYIQNVESGSSADVNGIEKDDRILELNGQDTTLLSVTQINDILETSKKERKLDILVIDRIGYEYSMKHAIPINSLLPFVQLRQERAVTNSRNQNEPVYL